MIYLIIYMQIFVTKYVVYFSMDYIRITVMIFNSFTRTLLGIYLQVD